MYDSPRIGSGGLVMLAHKVSSWTEYHCDRVLTKYMGNCYKNLLILFSTYNPTPFSPGNSPQVARTCNSLPLDLT